MTLEVNVDPPNPPSLAFHAGRGYVEVGRGGPDDHVVSLMAKELGSAPHWLTPWAKMERWPPANASTPPS